MFVGAPSLILSHCKIYYELRSVVLQFADPAREMATGLAYFKGVWAVMTSGFEASIGHATLDSLLSRGGMMEKTGLLKRLVKAALKGVKGTGSLILVTVLTAIDLNIVAADQYIAIVLPGRMYQLEFERRGLAPESLSRTLEDAGTMTSPVIAVVYGFFNIRIMRVEKSHVAA